MRGCYASHKLLYNYFINYEKPLIFIMMLFFIIINGVIVMHHWKKDHIGIYNLTTGNCKYQYHNSSSWGQSWHSGTKCDCKTDWLWVWSPLEETKYLLKFIFPFLRSGVDAKRGVEFCHSTRNASIIWQKVGNEVSQH